MVELGDGVGWVAGGVVEISLLRLEVLCNVGCWSRSVTRGLGFWEWGQ